MPPWSVMEYPAKSMARYLGDSQNGARRFRIEVDGEDGGAVSIRHPWLKGFYLEFLAVPPEFQNQGVGAGILGWFEQKALRQEARNLWVCASSFNARALLFYERQGFRGVAALPSLVVDGYDEILLRKFPLGGASGPSHA